MFDDIKSSNDDMLERLTEIHEQMKMFQVEAEENIKYEHLLEMSITDQMQRVIQL